MFAYTGFISYASEDVAAAIKLQRDLESFRVPASLVATSGASASVQTSLGRFFRDRTDAAAAPDLRIALSAALSASRDLIVLCSPASADRRCWVNNEIRDFRRLRPDGRILPIILAGEPPDCFPPALRGDEAHASNVAPVFEPLAADMRTIADGPKEAVLKLIAALIGVEFDQLRRRREEVVRRRRNIAIGLGIGYVVSVTGAAVLVTNASLDLVWSRSSAIADRARLANDRGQYDLAVLLALTALPPQVGAVASSVPEAEAELARAVTANRLRRVMHVHDRNVLDMALHPTQPWILTGSVDGSIRISDWSTGQLVWDLPSHADYIGGLDFSSDGAAAVTAAADGTLRIWDVATGRAVRQFDFGDVAVRSVAFGPTGKLVLAGLSDGTVRVLEVSTGVELARSPDHGAFVGSVAIGANDRVLSGAFNGRLIEWSLRDGAVVHDYGQVGTIFDIAYDPSRDRWATTQALSSVMQFWAPSGGGVVARIDMGELAGTIAFSPDGRLVATAHWDRTARVFEVGSGHLLAVLQHSEWVDGAAFSADGRHIVTADHHGDVRVWQAPEAREQHLIRAEQREAPGSMVMSPNGEELLVGTWSGAVVARDLADGRERPVVREGGSGIKTLVITPDGQRLGILRQDNSVELRDTRTGMVVAAGHATTASDRGIAFLDRDRVVVASKDGRLQAWSLAEGREVAAAHLPEGVFGLAVAAAPDGRQVAIAATDGRLWIWIVDGELKPREGWRHERAIMSVDWSQNGEMIATGGADSRILIGSADGSIGPVSVTAGQAQGTWIYGVDFSADGQFLASADADGGVQIWATHPAALLSTTDVGSRGPNTSPLQVLHVLLAADASSVIAMNSAGEILRYGLALPTGDIRETACARLPIGRTGFNDREIQEFQFLRRDDIEPCQRAGPLSSVYWSRQICAGLASVALPCGPLADKSPSAPRHDGDYIVH